MARQGGRKARLVSFPDYGTSIGEEIARALAGERDYGPDVMQLLYVANRYEREADRMRWLNGGLILVCDRYLASSIAYGEAQGLDPAGSLRSRSSCRRRPHDHARHRPETAVQRKAHDRDRYERDLAHAGARPRELPAPGGGRRLGRARRRAPKDAIAADVISAVQSRLGPP